MDLSSIFLSLLLTDPDNSLEAWSDIRKSYLKGFESLIVAVETYYKKHAKLPNFGELEVTNRNTAVNTSINILKDVEIPEDVSIDTVASALLDTYTQDNALDALDKLLDTITMKSSHEIKEDIANISINLEEQTHSSADVVNMHDVSIITRPEEREAIVDLLFSNQFDAHSGGMGQSNYIMVGGFRGSGKSILGVNLAVQQYLAGNVGVIFSIEMPATEVFQRYLSVLANVSHSDIRNAELSQAQLVKLAKVRVGMFSDSEEAYKEFKSRAEDSETGDCDFPRLEKALQSCALKTDNQLLIIDNPSISITQIDLHLYKLKARFGEKLKVVTVDYVNVIQVPEGSGQFDWKAQLELSKGLKALASKHEVLIVAPMQTAEDGSTSFSKALLVPPDLVFNMRSDDSGMHFETIKARNIAYLNFSVGVDWDTLTIDPTAIPNTNNAKPKPKPTTGADDLHDY